MAWREGAACIAVLLAAGCAEAGACRPGLRIETHPEGQMLARLATGPQPGAFALHFLHSVSLTPVTSRYMIEGGRIVQRTEEFDQHGAGLPSGPAEPGSRLERRDGRFVLHLRREIPDLLVRVGAEHRNRLEGAETLDLTGWGDRRLRLRPEECSRGSEGQ
ncbi:MAG: DUF1850 domain-containing protein [Alphaproteobacteria bacterium]|nr:DUF1850 domain-containing protein [Alphaproteobacteria bacterium]